MTNTADATLRTIFRKHVQNRLVAPIEPTAFAEAAHAYAAASAEERRAAYWGFARRGWTLAPTPPAAVRATFVLGDDIGDDTALVVDGYDTGQRWNGWAVPLLDETAAGAFVAWLQQAIEDGGNCCAANHYTLTDDGLTVSHDESCACTEFVPYEAVLTADGPQRLLEVGLGFTWEVR